MKYSTIVDCFEQAGYRVEQIINQHGCIATIEAGARVIAVSDVPENESFLFNPAGILDKAALAKDLFCDHGAPGGDRLWIAPEYQYHWQSQPMDYVDYSNYEIAKAIDPSNYAMEKQADIISFDGDIDVKNHLTGSHSKMHVHRQIKQLKSPYKEPQVASASYQVSQSLTVTKGIGGLWNLTQLPTGSVVVFALRESAQPLDYFNPSDISIDENACAFYVDGYANTKIGYGTDVATGNSAAFYYQDNQLSMIYRRNNIIENGYYCDGIDANTPNNQVWQAWDGFGFGEIESHSIAAGEGTGNSMISDTSEIHCLRGSSDVVLELASQALELSVGHLSRLLVGRIL